MITRTNGAFGIFINKTSFGEREEPKKKDGNRKNKWIHSATKLIVFLSTPASLWPRRSFFPLRIKLDFPLNILRTSLIQIAHSVCY